MEPRSLITVAISRFDDLLALGLHALLASDPSVAIVAEDIVSERLAVTLQAHAPRVLILDVGALADLAQVRVLRGQHPDTRLVLLGQGMSSTESAQLLAFGASACLTKDTQGRDVRNAVHLASRGLQLMPLGAHGGGARVEDGLLTRREGDVLLLLRQGHSNAQIALALQIGVETVRTHARSIFRKLGVSSRRALGAVEPAPAVTPKPAAAAEPAPAARPAWRHAEARAVARRPRRG